MGLDPATIMVISAGVSAAGAGASFMGSQQQAAGMRAAGSAAASTARFNAGMRQRSERVFKQQAEFRERAGDKEALRFRNQFQKLQARAGTAYRKGGVSVSSGTPLEVLLANANEAEEEVQLIGLQARTEAGQLRERAVGQRLAGQLALIEGKTQQQAFNIRARSAEIAGYADLASTAGSLGMQSQLIK